MITHTFQVPATFLDYRKSMPLPEYTPLVFLDIETLGLSRQRDPIILIGLMHLKNSDGVLQQFFCEDPAEEKEMLQAALSSIPPEALLVTYNGRAFDIPYINHRLARYAFTYRIPPCRGIDLMHWARKALPDAPRHTLKDVEKALGILREDVLSGGECVQQYLQYLRTGETQLAEDICGHNFEDILHMAPLLQLYAMLPYSSRQSPLPFYVTLLNQNIWLEVPVYRNGFLSLQGAAAFRDGGDAVNYTGSASLEIIKGNLTCSLPVIEFPYPEPGSLFVDTDRIPGYAPFSFNTLSGEEKMGLLVRRGARYLTDSLSGILDRLLAASHERR